MTEMEQSAAPSAPTDDEILWTADGKPRSRRFDDVFFSDADGLAESVHVFQQGVAFAARLAQNRLVRVGEIGFGLGLNFLAAWETLDRARAAAAAAADAAIDYAGFERRPPSADEIRKALAPWPDLAPRRDPLLTAWPPRDAEIELEPHVTLRIYVGDAERQIARLPQARDVWWLDGFSPAKNPDAWTPPLLRQIYEKTAPGGAVATYTAAGWVRRGLQAAGFEVARRPGFGAKREMLVGRRSA